MNKNSLIALVVILIIAAGIGIFVSQKKQKNDSITTTSVPTLTIAPTKSTISTEAGKMTPSVSSAENQIVVEGSNFKFNPSTITVKKGQKTKIVFKNVQGMHDFRVDELDISSNVIKTGQEESVEFTADKAGTFEYYCSVGQHRQMGMKGTLTVE